MILIAVVDDGGGLMFNRRRQSRDRALRDRILTLSGGAKLWMNAYAYQQFRDAADGAEIVVDEDFLSKAPDGDFCFMEDASANAYLARTERVILFRWNRAYPSDVRFDADLSAPPWKLVRTDEFPGFSHEKITEEIYERDETNASGRRASDASPDAVRPADGL